MEEQKVITPSAGEAKPEEEIQQLKYYVNELMQQNQQLTIELRKVTSALNKLPILFEVIKLKENFPNDFVKACVQEVVFMLTPPKEEPKGKEESAEKK